MSATPNTSFRRAPADRPAINRANSRHSTGPRADSGKQRSSLNALRHGLTAASAVLPSEDQAVYQTHRRSFFDEYQPATPTAWHQPHPAPRSPVVVPKPQPPIPNPDAGKRAAALLELHKHKGVPWVPSDHGFVFSRDHVERFAQRAMRLNERTARDALAG